MGALSVARFSGKNRLMFFLTALFVLSAHLLRAQGIDRSLYTSVKVYSTKPKPIDHFPNNEFNRLDTSKYLKEYTKPGLTISITDSTTKNRYDQELFVGYFINNLNDTLLLDRCDEAILETESQIFVHHKWTQFQLNLPSDCGWSYFTTKLTPKSFYVLTIPDPSSTEGTIETKFRIKLTYNHGVYYSNSKIVKLTEQRIKRATHAINPDPWAKINHTTWPISGLLFR